MSKKQYEAVIVNLIINQSMLVAILKILGFEKGEIDKLGELGEKTANELLKK